jgi:diguanylate cyclase (GGDEF)-like protein
VQVSIVSDIVRSARQALIAAFVAALFMLVAMSVERSYSTQAIADASARLRTATDVTQRILLADERLTMSAWMAASTGEARWQQRYDRYLPEIDAAIAEARALAPPAISARFDRETRIANDVLVDLETRAFAEIAEGDLAEARALLDGDRYARNKAVLAQGTDHFVAGLTRTAEARLAAVHQRSQNLLFGMLAFAAVLFALLWWWLNRRLSRTAMDHGHTERRLHMHAMSDELTGLPNRRSFHERAAVMLDRAGQSGIGVVGVAMLDIDHFKDVNDTLGHHVGDELIRQIARLIGAKLPDGSLLARLGGDEFAIAVNALNAQHAHRIIADAVAILADPITLHGEQLRVSTSGGLAVGHEHAGDVSDLLRLADIALYRAKEDGRGVVRLFEAEMDATIRARRDMENELRAAISEGQLCLHYQPLCDTPEGEISGLEALVRWNHPVKGLVPPAVFIPVAEQNGLIVELGAWVMERAFMDSKRWPDLIVAINLSPRQLRQPDFLPMVQKMVRKHRVKPSLFELEVTENLLLEESERVHQVLAGLHQMGFRIALDDFGTGYSSLSYLRKFAFHKIKIDQSFIKSLETSSEAAEIIRSVVNLGNALHMTVTAEGVETAEQRRFLEAAGCQQLQGYLFAHPAPADSVEAMLKQRGRKVA